MGLFSFLKKSASVNIEKLFPLQGQGFRMYTINSFAKNTVETLTVQGQANAYSLCQPVNTIVNRLAEALINGVVEVKNEKGELPSNYETKGYKKLFTQPNPFQTFSEFQLVAEVYRKVYGIVYILPIRPVGLTDRATNYYILPNTSLNIQYNNEKSILFSTSIADIYKSITFTFCGATYPIDPKALIIVKDSTPNLLEQNKSISISRLVSLQDQVSNITAAYESRGVLIKNRGAAGAISPKNSSSGMPLPTDEKENIEKKLQERYGILKDQYRYIVSTTGLDFTPFEMKVGDLKLFEEVEADTISIAESYSYPPQLLGISKSATYNNVTEAKLSLYENNILPSAKIWAEAYQSYFSRDVLNTNTIEISYKHLEIFQLSEKQKAEEFEIKRATTMQLFKDSVITFNQMLTELGQEAREGGDIYINQVQTISLAEKLGVGGLQGLLLVLGDVTKTNIDKSNILQVVFKIGKEEADKLAGVVI